MVPGAGALQNVVHRVVDRHVGIVGVVVAILAAQTIVLRHVVTIGGAVERSVGPLPQDELLRVQGRIHARGLAELVVHVVTYRNTAGLRTLRGDEDNAVRTAGTVDGGGGSVLQNVDGLDLFRRDVRKRSGHAVDEDERVVALGDGVTTTDADGRGGTRGTRTRGNANAGETSLDGLGRIGDRHLGDLLAGDRSDGTRQVATLDLLVTDENDFVQEKGILFEGEVERSLSRGRGELDVLVTHAGNDNCRICRHVEFVLTIQIGNGTVLGALDHHSGSDDRTLCVDDRT